MTEPPIGDESTASRSVGGPLRDILTVIAALVILVLTAALVVPRPSSIGRRIASTLDRAISPRRPAPQAQTEGRIRVRLLPSPRVSVDRLGSAPPDRTRPRLTADVVRAEIALTPLLRGEVRFTETRVGRAEIRIPIGADGAWRLPPDLPAARRCGATGPSRTWRRAAPRDAQVTPTTGRTDQFYAESVRDRRPDRSPAPGASRA